MAPRARKQIEPVPAEPEVEETSGSETESEEAAPRPTAAPARTIDPRKRESMLRAREKAMEILKQRSSEKSDLKAKKKELGELQRRRDAELVEAELMKTKADLEELDRFRSKVQAPRRKQPVAESEGSSEEEEEKPRRRRPASKPVNVPPPPPPGPRAVVEAGYQMRVNALRARMLKDMISLR